MKEGRRVTTVGENTSTVPSIVKGGSTSQDFRVDLKKGIFMAYFFALLFKY